MERLSKVDKLIKLEENIVTLNAIMKGLTSAYILDGEITISFSTHIFDNIYGCEDIPRNFNITNDVFIKTIEQTLIATLNERDKIVKELYDKWKEGIKPSFFIVLLILSTNRIRSHEYKYHQIGADLLRMHFLILDNGILV